MLLKNLFALNGREAVLQATECLSPLNNKKAEKDAYERVF